MHDLEKMDYYYDTRTITPWQDFKIKMAYVIMFIEVNRKNKPKVQMMPNFSGWRLSGFGCG